ncbi:MAG: glycosyltransferase family 4 protein [Candidatus Saccharibacteria bacterium]
MTLGVHGNANDIHTQRWVKWFAKRGYDIVLIDYRISDEAKAKFKNYKNLKFVELGEFSKIPILRDLQIALRFSKIDKEENLNSLTCHSGPTGFRPALSGIHPLILVAFGSDFFMLPQRSPVWRRLYRWMAKHTDYVLCDSNHLIDEVKQYGFNEKRIKLYHLGVDTDLFAYDLDRDKWRVKLGIPLDVPVIYHTRILSEDYRVHRLLEAMLLVWDQRPEAVCILKDYHSDIAYRERLDDLIKKHGKEDRVRYVPTVDYEELPYLFAMSDMAVSIRVTDSAPVSVLESIAMRKPIIASNLPNLREWIEDGVTGYLVNVDDPGQIASRILTLINEPDKGKAMAEEAYLKNIQEISMDVTMKKIEAIYMNG